MKTTMIAPAAERTPEVSDSKLNTIVCGTDFAVQAQEAADAAAALAIRTGATLVLVHVYDPVSAPNDPTLFKATSAKAQEALIKEAQRLRDCGATVDEEFLMGSPPSALAELALRREADFLVVSSRGMVAPAQFVTGSVAERAAANSPIPTIVVRGGAAFQNWAKGIAPLKVFLAYDFSSTADDALEWLRKLCGIGSCEITVSYAAYPPQESWRLGIGEHGWLDALPLEVQRLLQRDIKERVTEILGHGDFKIRVEPVWGRADALLLSLARESDADLIIVGTHHLHGFGRFWLGSVSRAILRDSTCSVAIVPPSPARTVNAPGIPTIRRVLVTTDFSELGDRAVRHAYSLLPGGGTVCLVHVATPHGVNVSSHPRLHALIPPEADGRNVATVIDVVESHHPAEAICQAAERFAADVICMASHGRSGISKLFMGSVAQDVVGRSTRPVLVVRASAE